METETDTETDTERVATKKRTISVQSAAVAAYECQPCINLRSRDGWCTKHNLIPGQRCDLYDAIAGRHAEHRKIIGDL